MEIEERCWSNQKFVVLVQILLRAKWLKIQKTNQIFVDRQNIKLGVEFVVFSCCH